MFLCVLIKKIYQANKCQRVIGVVQSHDSILKNHLFFFFFLMVSRVRTLNQCELNSHEQRIMSFNDIWACSYITLLVYVLYTTNVFLHVPSMFVQYTYTSSVGFWTIPLVGTNYGRITSTIIRRGTETQSFLSKLCGK